MCGIVGVLDYSKDITKSEVDVMRDIITYRGPDDFGTEIYENKEYILSLAHRRLSIQDLSPLGHQPMSFESLSIVFNGEVYNFEEIRNELISLNYEFRSDGDTEVILKAFHAWGVKCVDKFRGMFAFAIYDMKNEKLFIFRDRMGVKPLYYYLEDNKFLFSSELKSIYKFRHFSKKINNNSLPYYFRFGYIPAPLTIFENTFKLLPAHYIEYDLRNKKFEEKKYWDVKDYFYSDKTNESEDKIVNELENILIDSFNLRMVSDVPVGVFLSGGVDSSLVASLIQKNSKEPINTFTIGFNEKNYDEAIFAKEIANHIGSSHTELYCDSKDMLEIIKDLPFLYDEPFGDSSALPTILVSKLAKEKVSVVLSGDGGDESFVGYSKYFALEKIAKINDNKIQKNIIKNILNLFNATTIEKVNNILPNKLKQRNIKDKYQKFKNAVESESFEEMFINASSYVDNKTLEKVLLNNKIDFSNTSFNLNLDKKISELDLMSLMDYKTFLVDDVLTKVDRASMSVSIEAREPLLDHKIIEFTATIPSDVKYKNKIGKTLLKKVLYKYVPKELIERPKSGFQIPLEDWLKKELKPLVDKYLSSESLQKSNIYNVKEIELLLNKFYEGKNVNVSLIWFILMFEMWKEEWNV